MADLHSQCMGMGSGMGQRLGKRSMDSIILCRDVRTGSRQGQLPESIVSNFGLINHT